MALLQRVLAVTLTALALSVTPAAVAARIFTPDGGEVIIEDANQASIHFINQLNVFLHLQCDLNHMGSIAAFRADHFEFPIGSLGEFRCTLSASASPPVSPDLSGTFVVWAKGAAFNPANFAYWLVNAQGLWAVPNDDSGVSPQQGTLIYPWPQH